MTFMQELRGVCDALKEDFWLMGEVIHGDYSRYANGEMLHAVTNYELHKGLFSGHNDHNYFEIAHSVKRLLEICKNTLLYTFSDNHDVSRLASKLADKGHLGLVAMLVYNLPGIPSIYYGSEFGIEGEKHNGDDWNLRPSLELETFEDNQEATGLCELYTRLGEIKKEYEVLSSGGYEELLLTNRQYAFARTYDNQSIVTVLNNDTQPIQVEVRMPIGATEVRDLFSPDASCEVRDGKLVVSLENNQGKVFYLKS